MDTTALAFMHLTLLGVAIAIAVNKRRMPRICVITASIYFGWSALSCFCVGFDARTPGAFLMMEATAMALGYGAYLTWRRPHRAAR